MSVIPPEVINASNNFSIWNMINNADFIVQIIIILLAILSVISWATALEKYKLFKTFVARLTNFEKSFWTNNIDIYIDKFNSENNYDKKNNPINNLISIALKKYNQIKAINSNDIDIKESIYHQLENEYNKIINSLEEKLSLLATFGSISPFIGLLGTVWGIMSSFKSISMEKNTNIAVIAPGIAEALLVTAIGLFVAIPAVLFYNHYTSRISNIENRLKNIINEITNNIYISSFKK